MIGVVEVEAENLEEAIRIAEYDEVALCFPDEEYLEDSFDIDREIVKEFNKHEEVDSKNC